MTNFRLKYTISHNHIKKYAKENFIKLPCP